MSSGRVAVVAPLSEEVAALAGRLEKRVLRRAGDLRFTEGSLCRRRVAVAATGDGARRASRGLIALIEAVEPTEVWVLGVAGGVSPELEIGDLVAAEAVRDEATGEVLRPAVECAAGVLTGVVVSAERIQSFARDKRRLWEELGCPSPAVVDVESAACARAADAAGVPWRVLRAVSDSAAVDLPLDFETFRDEEGSLERSRIARYAALRPGVVRRLLELRGVVERCSDRLADAVVRHFEIER